MADLLGFDTRTREDYERAQADSKAFYGGAQQTIDLACGAKAHLDMDGCGYRCASCFAMAGSASACYEST